DVLGREGEDVRRRKIALDCPLLLRTVRSATAPAEEDRHPAVDVPLAHVDMGKQYGGLQTRIAQYKMDRTLVVTDGEPEVSTRRGEGQRYLGAPLQVCL